MAEIRTESEGMPATPRSDLHAAENLSDRPADHLAAGHALPGGTPSRSTASDPAAVVADDPEAVRSEIESTRERMSSTIDEIESVLARKKERLQDKLDVLSPVRERPLQATGIAFGVGLALGLLTGGGDDSDDDDRHLPRARSNRPGLGAMSMGAMEADSDEGSHGRHTGDPAERAAMWESRARRLLRVAREQEEKIRELQERYGLLYAREVELSGGWEDDEAASGELMSSVGSLRDTVLHGITGFLTDAFHQMGKGSSSSSHA
jgi:ElaB/YqjD/DUF883 family membrane-anchored ribosome-binding protein